MQSKDLYLLTTDKDGKEYVSDHRVWDEMTFINSRQKLAAKEGGSVSKISKATYDQIRGRK